MEEWKTYKLGDLVNLYSGGTPNKSKAGYWGGSIPWISAKSMYEDFLSTSDLFITESGLKAGSKLAKKDTILLLTRGSGLFNRIPVCWTERDLAFNQDVKNIVSKDDSVLLNQYLYYWLYGNKAGITAILETTGIGAGKIDTERFLSLDVSIPSVDEQNRIIRIVEPIFDKIAINNRINHNLEEQARSLYKSWFIDFEPFKDGKFVDSELGMIPEGWHIGTLSEIADITMGQSPSGSSFNEDGHGIVFYQGRTEFGFRFPSIKLFTTEPTRFAEPHSVLVSVRAPVGDINVALDRCCIGRGLAAITAKDEAFSFVLYTLKGKSSELDLYNGEGTVFGSINRKDLEGLSVLIPPMSIIQQFNDCIRPIDESIEIACKEIVNLSFSRDSLLPRLMSGQLSFDECDC